MVFVPQVQTHTALSILQELKALSPGGLEVGTVRGVTQLIANCLSAAKVTPMEMAREAGPDQPALLTVAGHSKQDLSSMLLNELVTITLSPLLRVVSQSMVYDLEGSKPEGSIHGLWCWRQAVTEMASFG